MKKSNPTTGQPPDVLTVADVAALFRVDPKTVVRWADAGKLSSFRTLAVAPGHPGHRRFRRAEVEALLSGRDNRAEVEARAAWALVRELLDAGREITFYPPREGRWYSVGIFPLDDLREQRFAQSPEAAFLAAREDVQR